MPPFDPEGSTNAPSRSERRSDGGFAFGPYQLDTRSRRLLRHGQPVPLTRRQYDVLHTLVASAGAFVDKDAIMRAGWPDQIVGDASIHKLMSDLRTCLDDGKRDRYIRNRQNFGYHFVAETTPFEPDFDLDALTAPHRIWIEGRAALESLECNRIAAARAALEQLVASHPQHVPFQIGLANACVLQFEATRTDPEPNIDALRLARLHAERACRDKPDHAEAWATLGFVLDRNGNRVAALAALQRAVMLEPDNWLIECRHAASSWGEERYRAVRRTLTLRPHFPMAHWLAASVLVGRGAFDLAEREIDAALSAMIDASDGTSRFSAVAVHFLKGLLCLRRGADDDATRAFEEELAREGQGHLYSRECCANTWYVMGACHLRRGDTHAARAAFEEAITRVPRHPMAHAGMVMLDGRAPAAMPGADNASPPFEMFMARAALLVAAGDAAGAARLLSAALDNAPPGNAGWLIPLDPLLAVDRQPDVWAAVLRRLRERAG